MAAILQHELQLMSTLWQRVKAGKGQVMLLCGEAGIGKSRLCEVWLDRIADEPHVNIQSWLHPETQFPESSEGLLD